MDRGPTTSGEQPVGVTVREEDGSRKYRVWFGTNRQQERRNGRVSFGPARADRITYGYCDVTIPKYHRIGSVGDSWWSRFPRFWQNNRLAIKDLQLLAETAFYLNCESYLTTCLMMNAFFWSSCTIQREL